MCNFITATCSSKTKLTDINSIGEIYGFTFEDCDNEHIANQILKSEKYLLKVSKMCDCGTSLGEAFFKNDKTERVQKSEIDKLKKKGWSETKITRYLVDKKKTEHKLILQQEVILKRQSKELDNYINFIKDVLKKTDTETFGLLLHWYSSGPDNEKIKLSDRKNMSHEALTVLDLKMLEDDKILCVTR